jgi:hypothetical protein
MYKSLINIYNFIDNFPFDRDGNLLSIFKKPKQVCKNTKKLSEGHAGGKKIYNPNYKKK